MRQKIVAGNWKMNCTSNEAFKLAKQIKDSSKIKVIISPPFTGLVSAMKGIGKKNISVAAQNMHFEEKGAFTGEISPLMLKEINCTYVIIGHSERRHIFGESDKEINKKISAAINHGLKVIFCIGETLKERKSDKARRVIADQIEIGLSGINHINDVVIAYEPVWAIGTGVVATPLQAEEAHKQIRENITKLYGKKAADKMKILYGGSVNENNAASLLILEDVDGALVGGASLNPKTFNEIITIAEKIK